MDRRSFLASSAAASTALWLPKTSIAQTRPLNYYNVNAFSGNFAVSGKLSDYGVRASIKAFGNGLGRPIAYTKIDTAGNPAVAVRKVQQAIGQEHARHFGGAALSSEALAIMKEIDKAGGINANVWVGIVLLVIGVLFIVWARTRPIVVDEEELARDKAAVDEAAGRRPVE